MFESNLSYYSRDYSSIRSTPESLTMSSKFVQYLMRQSQQKSSAFLVCSNVLDASMANSVDPDQTAPIGAVCSGFTLFASILNSSVM